MHYTEEQLAAFEKAISMFKGDVNDLLFKAWFSRLKLFTVTEEAIVIEAENSMVGDVHQRIDRRHRQKEGHGAIARQDAQCGRAAGGRYTVPFQDRIHAGGVFPHLQPPLRGRQADHTFLRPPALGHPHQRG